MKKIILKRPTQKGSISAKIAQKQEDDKKAKKELFAKKILEQKKKSEPPAANLHSATKVAEPTKKDEVVAEKSFQPAVQEKPASKKSHFKQNTKLREDVLKEEEHKKFFLKHQANKGINKEVKGIQQRSSIPKEINITEFIQVGELAKKLNIKTSELISKLMKMGVMVTITQSIDAETAILVAEEFGCKVSVISLYEETLIHQKNDEGKDLETRPPVITIMGHVDHGKTKLLDSLRKTDIAAAESGGITQHIGAYQISTPKGKITFLDTPGHEAFTAMRSRGANLTDIIVIVVAADDGVMPQTIESIQHARNAKVPIIIAINKIDLADTNVKKIKQELNKYDIVSEDWGGDISFIEVSALKGTNLDKFKDLILTQAELMELKANPNRSAIGTVIEARLDQGRGTVTTVLIQNGTLKMGDSFIVGLRSGKVRAMLDSWGNKITEALPSTPVEILGSTGIPQAGDLLHVMESEKEMKAIVEKRKELDRQQRSQKIKKVKLENLNEAIEQGKLKDLNIIIKADVLGSAEAIESSIKKLSAEEIKVNVILTGSGEISESDIMLAIASNAFIIGFNVRANAKARSIAEKERISIYYFKIIYDVIDQIKKAMEGMLSPEIHENDLGTAEVRQLFKISSLGTIAGCLVTMGVIKRNSRIRVIRDGTQIYESNTKTLKRFKEDTNEVKEGFECGILIENFNDFKEKDILECYEYKEVSKTLN